MKLKAISICKDDKGRYVRPPAMFEVSDEKGKELVALGAAEPERKKRESGGKEAASGSSGGGELTQEQRNEKIRAALEGMLKEDPKQENNLLWTKAGQPRNKAVDKRAGLDVTNEELEPIWAKLDPKAQG